jgi:Ger(x)C family germination protein
MIRAGKTLAVWLLFPLLLTGCWDIKNVQDNNYLTSIGFDRKGDQYFAYVQMLDFSSVAKTESGKPNQPIPVWVGTGKGETLLAAFNDLYRTGQMRIFYGQVNSIVLGEGLLKESLKNVKELIDRYYEFRYTPWVFGTKEAIDKLFAMTPFFYLPPIMSILHQPQEIYKQQSFIAPLTLREAASQVREPGNSLALPSLSILKGDWKSDRKPKPMLGIDGAFLFQDEQYQGFLDLPSIPGLRWVEEKTQRSPLLVRVDGKPVAGIVLENPHVKIIPRIRDGQATFRVEIQISGYIDELLEPLTESALEQKAESIIQTDIRKTFEEGLKIQADLLHLEHTLYRKQNREWKKLRKQQAFILKPDSLEKIAVNVNLEHSGKLKFYTDL